jgi:hypothetical protein
MAFSGMNSKEKTIIAVLGAIILIALVGIGILIARMVAGNGIGEQAPVVTVLPTAAVAEATPEITITQVAAPSLSAAAAAAPVSVGEKPVVVARMQGPGPGFPVIIADQPLAAGHRYRLEVAAADGSQARIQGSWGQAATSASGQVAAPQIEFFEGVTPFSVDVSAPVTDPVLWGCSISAGPKDVPSSPPTLVITIYDVTGVK